MPKRCIYIVTDKLNYPSWQLLTFVSLTLFSRWSTFKHSCRSSALGPGCGRKRVKVIVPCLPPRERGIGKNKVNSTIDNMGNTFLGSSDPLSISKSHKHSRYILKYICFLKFPKVTKYSFHAYFWFGQYTIIFTFLDAMQCLSCLYLTA